MIKLLNYGIFLRPDIRSDRPDPQEISLLYKGTGMQMWEEVHTRTGKKHVDNIVTQSNASGIC